MKTVHRQEVPIVTEALFEFYFSNRLQVEQRPGYMGYFFKRVGSKLIIEWLKKNPKTSKIMSKSVNNPLSEEVESSKLVNPSLAGNHEKKK